jgi:outer membrane receptor for ferrienterochelin and colicin
MNLQGASAVRERSAASSRRLMASQQNKVAFIADESLHRDETRPPSPCRYHNAQFQYRITDAIDIAAGVDDVFDKGALIVAS